jgi:hypothetical protein
MVLSSRLYPTASVESESASKAARAIALARAQIGVEELVAGRAWLVRRVDLPGHDYYLVVFGNCTGSVAAATVDAATCQVGTTARLPGLSRHFSIDADQARAIANAPVEAAAELVWAPGKASRSPLYPVWRVTGPAGDLYVTHAGELVTQLQ